MSLDKLLNQKGVEALKDLNLTSEDFKNLEQRINSMKKAKENEIAYLEKLNKPSEAVNWDYEMTRKMISWKHMVIDVNNIKAIEKAKSLGKRFFLLDEWNRNQFHLLCLYYSNDSRFEAAGDNFSLNKGIMMFGDFGCGKTSLISLFSSNPHKPFRISDCNDIADEYQKLGPDVIDKYGSLQSAYPQLTFGYNQIGRCFDDLGAENEKKSYGNKANVLQEVLLKIYRQKIFHLTSITTNLTRPEIEDFYGERLGSRLYEMFNVITFSPDAPDRRKTM